MRQHSLARHALPVAIVLLALAPALAHSTSTIGLYVDQNGGLCSFSGNQSGLVTAYVVVKPDADGIRAVRFSVQIPECLGATLAGEVTPPFASSIGSSDTGISVAFPFCTTDPVYALEMHFLRTSTTPCCEVLIAPDPYVGIIQGANCVYDEIPMTSSTSRFNADATCPCGDSYPPHAPHSPIPQDYTTWASVTTGLYWSPSEFDGDIASYDLFLGTDDTPDLVGTLTESFYQPPQPLEYSTRYYWRVLVRDVEGMEALGPLWTFTTRLSNSPPRDPTNPNPGDFAINVPPDVTLSWTGGDSDGESVTYDVHFGDVSPPPLVASNLTTNTFQPPALSLGTVYYWRIVARDPQGAQTTGQIWQFTTRLLQNPPNPPTVVSPLNGSVNVSINPSLQWNGTDPDGDPLTYSVYFGSIAPPPLMASGLTAKTYSVGTLAFGTHFWWRIVARDPSGAETSSINWSFTTEGNDPPSVPANPVPANGASNVALSPVLSWTCTDEWPGLRYDVYFGTTSSPPLVAGNSTTNMYTPGALAVNQLYYWKVVARDAQGLTRTGPLWTFVTVTHPAPFSPNPADNTFAADPLTLLWSTTNPGAGAIQCDLYFGTTNPPPLFESAITPYAGTTAFRSSPPGNLVVGTHYYWRVYSYTSIGGTMGPVWSFQGGQLGDVNIDGAITLADAACALQVAIVNPACAPAGASSLADVNCAAGVTPRDALCIHRRAIGQTCLFCNEQLTSGESLLVPSVTRTALWQSGSIVYAVLAVSGVPSFEAFSFWVRHPTNVTLVGAVRRNATGGFTALETRTFSTYSVVGAYSLTPADASSATDFIELRLQLGGALFGNIFADSYVDDLAGAQPVTIVSATGGKGGGLPVVFSRFDASPDGDGVRIGWEFQHDDALESYTIFRSGDGAAPTVAIVQAPVTATAGSYLDHHVEPGKTYRYEMMVRARDGDEFRSPIATVTVAGFELALGANHPNPFNPQTTIPYTIPVDSAPVRVRLAIYDTSGRLVRVLVDETQTGGTRDVIWRGNDTNGKTVTSGVYFTVLQVGNDRRTRKLVLLK